jgi:hypothetical protein
VVLPAPARVPAAQLAWLVAEANLGELHKTLAPEARWLPPAGHDTMRREAQELLTALGWRDRLGHLEREVAASLAVLCRPRVEYYGWITHDGRTIGVLAGRTGKEALLAVHQADSTVWLSQTGANRLAERLVAQTPDVPAGSGTPFTVSASEVRATRPDGRRRTPTGAGVRRAGPEVRRTRRLVELPVGGFGELSVATRDEWGRRRRAAQPLRYTDTSEGRFALLPGAGDGEVRVTPAGRDDLVRHLTTMASG